MKISVSKILLGLTALCLTTGNIAYAEYRAYSYYELHGYNKELQHCVDLLRPNLFIQNQERASFVVDEISLRGPWYEFSISASVTSADGSERLNGFRVSCKSNRWIQSARLIESRSNPSASPTLFVKNSGDLVTHTALARNTRTAR